MYQKIFHISLYNFVILKLISGKYDIIVNESHTELFFDGVIPKEREILKTNVPLAATEGTNKK